MAKRTPWQHHMLIPAYGMPSKTLPRTPVNKGPSLAPSPTDYRRASFSALMHCPWFLDPSAHAFLRVAPTTSRTESITSSGFSPWMKWPLLVSVMCSASRCAASCS